MLITHSQLTSTPRRSRHAGGQAGGRADKRASTQARDSRLATQEQNEDEKDDEWEKHQQRQICVCVDAKSAIGVEIVQFGFTLKSFGENEFVGGGRGGRNGALG